ncbi:MAG TPA: hypothetical protein VMM79_02045 [Longimicrobiales bacterium]|nr:hypothetical protein [Longimicrobiales bacterium]
MPCLAAIVALMAPRFLIVVLWFFSNFFSGVFATLLWPVLGFLFLPTTLLWYVAVQHWFGGDWNGVIQIAGIVLALLTDISPAGGKRNRK